MIKLVILDIDGVMSDGRKYYGVDGIPFAKTYCDKDFTAIKRAMAKNRNIDFYSARGRDKAEFLDDFESIYQVDRKSMLYIGDDLFDKSIMELVGYAFCPRDSVEELRTLCGPGNIVPKNGGDNVICEMYYMIKSRGLIQDCTMDDIEALDKKETF